MLYTGSISWILHKKCRAEPKLTLDKPSNQLFLIYFPSVPSYVRGIGGTTELYATELDNSVKCLSILQLSNLFVALAERSV